MPVTDTDYNSTYALTDVINNAATDGINDTGLLQGSLKSFLDDLVTNFNGTVTKLDSDAGVSGSSFNTSYALTTMSSRGIFSDGMHQGDLYNALSEIETNFNGCLTELDSDGGTSDSDYNSTLAVDLKDTASGTGISQDDLVSFLDDVLANVNALLTKLDAD